MSSDTAKPALDSRLRGNDVRARSSAFTDELIAAAGLMYGGTAAPTVEVCRPSSRRPPTGSFPIG